jgi:hypothetical protein
MGGGYISYGFENGPQDGFDYELFTGVWDIELTYWNYGGDGITNADGIGVSAARFSRSSRRITVGPVHSISGTVAAADTPPGDVYVGLFGTQPGMILGTRLAGLGPYTLTNVPEAEGYQVRAFFDLDRDGDLSPGDRRGEYAGNPLSVTGDLKDVDVIVPGFRPYLYCGWNVVSVPVATAMTFTQIFSDGQRGSIIQGSVWRWDAMAQQYVPVADSATPTVQGGYWINSANGGWCQPIAGPPASGTINLAVGWNLVGPAADCALAVQPGLLLPAWCWNAPRQRYTVVAAAEKLAIGSAAWFYTTTPTPLALGGD